QCVFMALLKKSGRIEQEANISGWLFKTARHCCNRALRNDNTRRRHERAAARMRPDAVAVEAPMRDEELIPLLDEQLARLGQADRTALLLRYYERRSLREVGDVLGISEEAAKKRVQRALEKLRSRMIRKQIPLASETLTAILADKLVQPAPAKLTAVILAHAAHGTTATVTSAGQTKMLAHMSLKGLASGKTALAATGAVLATALVAAGIAVALAGHNRPKAPQELIISRATTYITSPLGKDGLPDYKLALKEYLMKGVTPENNAAVPAIEIAMQGYHLAPSGQWVDYGKLGAMQLKLLGVKRPHETFPHIHSIDLFFKKHQPQGYTLPGGRLTGLGGPDYWNMQQLEEGFAHDFPWRSSECLLLWAAMSREKAAVKIMQKASLLPRFYLPEVLGKAYTKWPLFYDEPLRDVLCSTGGVLAFRATLELGRGHPHKCWRDAMAVYRLALLARHEADVMGISGSGELIRQFLSVDRVLLGTARSHPHEISHIWQIIHEIPLASPLTKRYIQVQRLQALRMLLICYRKQKQPPMPPLAQTFSKQALPWKIVLHPPAAVNWNWQFSHLNETFDQLTTMAAASAYSAAGMRLRSLQNLWTSAGDDISVMAGYSPPVLPGTVGYIPKSLNRLFSKKLPLNLRYHNLVLLATNALYGWSQSGYQTLRSLMLVKIAYALEMYRHKFGNYPDTLAALSPTFFKHPPVDPVTGKFPIYIHEGSGYELTLYRWMLRPNLPPHIPFFGPSRIIMPPPPPRKWQKGPFP
ncbi:MAG: RNA polymerase sigma factor, partial [Phycisphaerae bacterium]